MHLLESYTADLSMLSGISGFPLEMKYLLLKEMVCRNLGRNLHRISDLHRELPYSINCHTPSKYRSTCSWLIQKDLFCQAPKSCTTHK